MNLFRCYVDLLLKIKVSNFYSMRLWNIFQARSTFLQRLVMIQTIWKKFYLVKDAKIKTFIQGKDVELKVRLVLWSGGRIQALLSEIQEEMRVRVRKLLGLESKLEITCDVQRIEDHEADDAEINERAASV